MRFTSIKEFNELTKDLMVEELYVDERHELLKSILLSIQENTMKVHSEKDPRNPLRKIIKQPEIIKVVKLISYAHASDLLKHQKPTNTFVKLLKECNCKLLSSSTGLFKHKQEGIITKQGIILFRNESLTTL